MKKSLFLCVVFALCCNLFAQTEVENGSDDLPPPPATVRVGVLNGPSCIPAAWMMETKPAADQIACTYEKFADPQALLPKMIKSEIDIGFMPVNVAAKVYNSSNKAIICAAVCGNGNLSIITKDKSVKKPDDLEGKTIYVAGQGATPEYISKYVFEQYDLSTPAEFDFSIPTANLAASLISDKIQYAVVPEPFATVATTKDSTIFYAIDLQKEYRSLSGNDTYPLTCIVVRAKFAKENPEAVKAYLKEFEKSVTWTNANPALAGEYCQKNDLGLAAPIVKKAIPKANFVYIPALEAKKEIEDMLKIFMQFNAESVGKTLPDDGFYLK